MRALVILALFASLPAQGAPSRAELERYADQAAAEQRVPVRLLKAVCTVESDWRPRVQGDDGASIGLCQIQINTGLLLYGPAWMRGQPESARRAAMRRMLLTPTANLRVAARLLRRYLDRFDGDETLALMAYNGGPNHALIRYVLKVRAAQGGYTE